MISLVFLIAVQTALCTHDATRRGCELRPGQCVKVDGVELCLKRPPEPEGHSP
jgi:hypothetical protein